jgi:hypothetical protein
MNTDHLVYEYIQKRRELTDACAQAKWKSCRAGHVQRISRELATIEDALEATDIDEAIFGSMILGRLDAPASVAPGAFSSIVPSKPQDERLLPSCQLS